VATATAATTASASDDDDYNDSYQRQRQYNNGDDDAIDTMHQKIILVGNWHGGEVLLTSSARMQ